MFGFNRDEMQGLSRVVFENCNNNHILGLRLIISAIGWSVPCAPVFGVPLPPAGLRGVAIAWCRLAIALRRLSRPGILAVVVAVEHRLFHERDNVCG